MIYTLTFKFQGKYYSNSEVVAKKCRSHQYEAVACGLLLGKIDQEKFSREDKYMDLCLTEQDENISFKNVVWVASVYVPISVEVK